MIKTLQSISLLAVLIFLIAGYSVLTASIASAQATNIPPGLELNGHAWSSNIGWISLNCRTGGAGGENICPGSSGSGPKVDYRVRINSNGHLGGWAWSPHIGWIRFNFNNIDNTATIFPAIAGSDTSPESARVVGNYPNNLAFRGWMRACSGTNSAPGSCNLMGNSEVSGGWDGWISLRGTNYGVHSSRFQGVTPPVDYDQNDSQRYAWGSTVVGWLDMATRVSFYEPANIRGTRCTIDDGESTCSGTLTWQIPNDINNPRVVHSWPHPVTPISDSRIGDGQRITLRFGPETSSNRGRNTFAIRGNNSNTDIARWWTDVSCTEAGSTPDSSGVCAPATAVSPVITLEARPSIVRRGGTVRLSWTIDQIPDGGVCRLSGPNVNEEVSAGSNHRDIPNVNNTSQYTMRCSGGSFSMVERQLTVNVLPSVSEI